MSLERLNTEQSELADSISKHIQYFCNTVKTRSVGSPGNNLATDYAAEWFQKCGFSVESPEFDCMDWDCGPVKLIAGEESFSAFASPYSLQGNFTNTLAAARTQVELEKLEMTGKILLIYGELAKEQIMPKNFVFYNPDEHQQIIKTLEKKQPCAIITATAKNPELAGGMYPFPMFEDGDFNIPSVYITDTEGERLCKHVGEQISLQFTAKRISAKGCNVIARKGQVKDHKIVFCAHIDAKTNTPGALDNAGGTAVLLALAELLKNYKGEKSIEIIAFNGEDYYAAPGQMQYLLNNKAELKNIDLLINIDGAGLVNTKTAFSFYECSEKCINSINNIFSSFKDMINGTQWYQGDHMIFVQNNVPAMAITTQEFNYICANYTHTPKDTPGLLDLQKLAGIALALNALFLDL